MWLETSRLILRNFQPEDEPVLAAILANSQVMQFSPTGVLTTSQTQEKIASFISSYEQFGFGKWAVVFQKNERLIGYCGMAIERIDQRDEVEIGFRLLPEFWGCGLATEAARATVDYGCKQLKLHYILGIVERENRASVRVLEKLGMNYVGNTIFYGTAMDVYRLDCNSRQD